MATKQPSGPIKLRPQAGPGQRLARPPCRQRPRLAVVAGRPGLARLAAAALLGLVLAGCSPEYDWRELRPSGAGWVALLPGRPATTTRDIRLGDVPVRMTMHGAKVHDTAFTVAYAPLPEGSVAGDPTAAMRTALVRNIDGRETAAAPVAVPVLDASDRPGGTAQGLAIEATGRIQGKPAVMMARLVVHGPRVYQALVIGTDVDREQAAAFFDSFRLHD